MHLKTKGLVLREIEYKDYDKILTVLTADFGKMTMKARGVRRKSSPLKAACQLLTYSEFTLFEYRDMATINEAQPIALFSGVRTDLELLSLGSYFAQAAEVLSQEDAPNPELLSLTLNALYAIGELGKPTALVKAAFELRAACIAGFTPDLSGCRCCGNPRADFLDLSAGCLECANCRDGESQGIRMPLNPGMLAALRYMADCDGKKLFSFHLPEETLDQLSSVTESYLTTQLERGFSALDFYKSLF